MPTNLLLISFYAEKSETVYQTKVMSTDFLEKLYCASPFLSGGSFVFFMEDIIFVRFNIFFLSHSIQNQTKIYTQENCTTLFLQQGNASAVLPRPWKPMKFRSSLSKARMKLDVSTHNVKWTRFRKNSTSWTRLWRIFSSGGADQYNKPNLVFLFSF